MRVVATVEPWASRAVFVGARPPSHAVPSGVAALLLPSLAVPRGVAALLLLSFVFVCWQRTALHVFLDLLFVVHQLIFANVLTNSVSHRFSFLLYPPH